MAYLNQAYKTDEANALLPEAEKTHYDNNAIWATAAFAIAVFGGVLASIALLIRKNRKIFIFSILNWYSSINDL